MTTARDCRGPAPMAAQQWTRASRVSVSAQPATRENTAKQKGPEVQQNYVHQKVKDQNP